MEVVLEPLLLAMSLRAVRVPSPHLPSARGDYMEQAPTPLLSRPGAETPSTHSSNVRTP
ncbi:MAG: hypothetical protein V7L21_26330 [Nostoc sp.]|uniref:hypothetical protein n=1 Tax=unclassified Nostoc TaxID=2593658 RepID=UPI0025F2ACB5|nr:hypothetical protein [Nostoc sp. NMS9]MBN3942998.1 hypothetical protein [Nostoc sp. NMS9]